MSSSALASGLRYLRGKMAVQCRSGESDEQLLSAFLSRREEDAFAVLVHRHGPMVLHVCRRVLGHEQDAEDAFQATFLALARNAAALRNKTALAAFLHGTAYRIALTAKRSAARRHKYESQAPPHTAIDPSEELSWREVRTLLDEEIARLPEKYRSVFILCCLENLSQAEAARRLGLNERTLSSQLAEARKRLQKRLVRRGVELTAVLAATGTASALPMGLMTTTIEAAMVTATGEGLAGVVSASVAELVKSATAAMIVSKAKTATLLLVTATLLAGAGAWTCRTLATPQPAELRTKAPASPSQPTLARQTESLRQENGDSVMMKGRVLNPDGNPVVGARVYVDPQSPEEKPIASTTGKDGRFSLKFARSCLVEAETKFPLRCVRLVATAKEHGIDWLEVPLDDVGKEATLRLVKDDIPIQGRIISLEGKPLAGIKVRVKAIEEFPKGDLNRALDAQRKGTQISNSTEVRLLWYRQHLPVPSLMATTDADGRFRLEGLGRERIITLNVAGPGIHYSFMRAMTRRAESVRSPYKDSILYGATFEYLAKPSRLIRGTVREKGTGKPLAGIRIHDMGFTGGMTDDATTDEQGRYELPGCSKGERYGLYALPIHDQPYLLSSIGLKDTEGLGPLTADLEMVRGIPCEGKVFDGETGQPVPGDINYYPLYPNPNVTSGIGLSNALRGTRFGSYAPFSRASVEADGSFRCVVLAGGGCLAFRAREFKRYVLACIDPGKVKARGDKMILHAMNGEDMLFGLFQEQFQAIQLIEPTKDTKKVSEIIRVAVARQVGGTVLDADGKPLTGVRVRGLMRWEWKTLADEKFTVLGVNPLRPRRLHFVHEGKHSIGTVEVKGTETKPLTVQLQPWAAVRGRLLDADGLPLRNAKLYGSNILPEDCRTDGEGRFRLEWLIPGLRYDLTYEKDKPFVSGMLLKDFVGKPGEVRDLGDVRDQSLRKE
jgi:RNA polymerase sigma factor (sigma-70 family)